MQENEKSGGGGGGKDKKNFIIKAINFSMRKIIL